MSEPMTWAEALSVPCGHCRHGAQWHGRLERGGAQCGICYCYQPPGSENAKTIHEALAIADRLQLERTQGAAS